MLLWFIGVPRVGIGLGGFVGIIGVGLLVNSLFYSPPAIPPPPSVSPIAILIDTCKSADNLFEIDGGQKSLND